MFNLFFMLFFFLLPFPYMETLLKILGRGIVAYAVSAFIIAAATMAAGKILQIILSKIVNRIAKRTESNLDDLLLSIILERIVILFGISGVYLGLFHLRSGITKSYEDLSGILSYANGILFVLLSIVLTILCIRIVSVVVRKGLRRIAERRETNFDQTLSPLIERVINIVIIVFALVVVLEHFGQNISTLLVSLGIGSLAIALAAQDTLSNMIAGFVIMLDRPFRVGDRVKIPSGEEGDIYEVGVRSTKILDYDNNLLIVPNNELIKAKIVNYSYPDESMRVVVEANVEYGTEIETIKKIFLAAAAAHPLVLKNPEPQCFLIKFADFAVQYKLFCRVASFKDTFTTGEDLRRIIYNEFIKYRISFAIPQEKISFAAESTENALHTGKKRKNI